MDDDIEYSSDGELMFSGPTSSEYLVVVDSEFPRQIQNHPFHPSHPLFLVQRKTNGRNTCDSCHLNCGEGIFFYRCDLCDFDLDTNCAKLIPTIKYIGHPDHFLSLYNIDSSAFYYRCNACQKKCGGHVLRCVPCNFNLHLHCLPHKVKHKNHCHFFTLTAYIKEEDRGLNELDCYECEGKINPDEPVYYCAKCYFPLHIGCSSEAIADHPKSRRVWVGVTAVKQSVGELMLTRDGELMFASPFRVDYSVVVDSEFPRQIQDHPFHPSHPLFLVKPKGSGGNECDSCRLFCGSDIFYRCDLCNFDLDTNCAKLIPTIKYLGHPVHLLSLFHIDYSAFYYRCNACQKKCGGHVLRCVPCNFNLHVDCLPHKVKHKNHRHFFTLTTSIKEEDRGINELVCYECDAKIDPDEPVYYCANSGNFLHIGCSSEAIADHPESRRVWVGVDEGMMRLRRDVEEKTTNLINEQKAMVMLMNDVEVKTISLKKQKKELTALKARLQFLEQKTPHKETSTEFPLKIKHPFHSQHPLTLTAGKDDSIYYDCSVCMKHNDGFRYNCFECDFFLDLNCVLRKPTIKYHSHQKHLLIFLKKNYGYNKCDACGQLCEASPILRCADCNFNLHIDCFPSLPPTFKNPQCHLHTLTLTKSFAGDLSADEFYCDFCEDEGDPTQPVYYCEECPFVAHVTCVLYEELPSILAELDSTKRDGGVQESVFVDVSNDKIEDEVADKDPTLAKIEDENITLAKIGDEVEDENLTLAKIDAEMRKLQLKLEELQEKRARYLPHVI